MATFKSDILCDLGHMFSVDEHDEEVTYYPCKGGPPLTVRVIIEDDQRYVESETRIDRRSTLEVNILKDEKNAVTDSMGNAYGTGGITRPLRGDQLWRHEVDPEEIRYAYNGVIIEAGHGYWTLEFERRVVHRTGVDNMMGIG